ncbi:response regulator [Paenibacillaceae bacterium]|nr:response regulator [Paenibacillaceae bacterium]
MRNVLIVDDEKFVRISVMKCIDWHAHGFAEPRDAGNGEEALQILQREPVDIVLTDIKMPQMDGMALIKAIRDLQLDTEIIVLSCLNEFDYVRQALQLGACDYLFKPTMLPEDILQALVNAMNKINQREQTNHMIHSLSRKAYEHQRSLTESFLWEWIDGKQWTATELLDKTSELQMAWLNGEVRVMRLAADDLAACLSSKFKGNAYLLKYAVTNIVDETLQPYCSHYLLSRTPDEYVILFTLHPHEKQEQELLQQMCAQVRDNLKQYLNFAVAAALSKAACTLADVREAYLETAALMQPGDSIAAAPEYRYEIQEAIAYIDAHLGENDLGLERVSAHIKISKNYLSRLFKEVVGVSYIDFVTERRLEKARELYRTSDLRVYEIAEKVGYADWRYFTKVFKKTYGHPISDEE